ncbi:MAG: polysaccharide pyruvyl transferase family protein [Nodosilinea sp. WJT8-NPBG4]|jgi:hypothetical protein|nr:polysaccharide pyruvyl transferase family protein [Nodosilinea sp. WJT8-NPBG4]
MKIGILTFHHVDNYGAVLQAYALQKFLRDAGHNVETIDRRPVGAIKYYTKGLSPLSKSLKVNSDFLPKITRAWKVRQFMLKNLRLSKGPIYRKDSLKKLRNHYDAVIVGSDQVWCLESFRGFDPSFFLDFVDNSKLKLSYAASFGSTTSLGAYRGRVETLVQAFGDILVRDANSKNIVSKELGCDSKVVLDPTFLVNYGEVVKPTKIAEDFLLIYNQASLTKEQEGFVQKICENKNLKIVSVRNPNSIADENFLTADPSEWLGLFEAASYVVTNTYHGTIFALINQKPFTVLHSSNKTNKTADLLRGMGLENRILLEPNNPERLNEHLSAIDYVEVQKTIASKVRYSKTALLTALSKYS